MHAILQLTILCFNEDNLFSSEQVWSALAIDRDNQGPKLRNSQARHLSIDIPQNIMARLSNLFPNTPFLSLFQDTARFKATRLKLGFTLLAWKGLKLIADIYLFRALFQSIRPKVSQFENLKIHRSTKCIYCRNVDRLIWRPKNCEKVSRASFDHVFSPLFRRTAHSIGAFICIVPCWGGVRDFFISDIYLLPPDNLFFYSQHFW